LAFRPLARAPGKARPVDRACGVVVQRRYGFPGCTPSALSLLELGCGQCEKRIRPTAEA